MPVQTTYPGVYVEEIPSGVKTISGVSTSIAAFIGSAKKGHENKPTTIFNYGDYERLFGGLWDLSTMSFAVRDFFQNGGGEAIIVRVSNSAIAATLPIADEITISASSGGEWGDGISFWIDHETKTPSDDTLFNLHVEHTDGQVEHVLNLSIVETSPNYALNVIKQKSSLIVIDSLDARPSEIADTAKVSLADGSNGTVPISDTELLGSETNKTGLYALEKADIFNILCIPPYTKTDDIGAGTYEEAMNY